MLRIPRVYENVQLLVAHQIQLEGFIPVELQITRSHNCTCLVDTVAFQHAVQVPDHRLLRLGRFGHGPKSATGKQMDPQHAGHSDGVNH